MLFWETLQCNKRYRSFIIDTNRGHDFVILVLFYALEYKTDPTKQGVVRMCVFVLQTLSTEPNFGDRLNKKFEGQESLPTSIRLNDFSGTYADFLINVSHGLSFIKYLTDGESLYIHSSRPARENWMQSILLYSQPSTMSPRT